MKINWYGSIDVFFKQTKDELCQKIVIEKLPSKAKLNI